MDNGDARSADRDTVLRKVRSEGLSRSSSRGSGHGAVAAHREILGLVCEGLSFASRPLDQVSQDIGREFNLSPRGSFILALLSRGVRYPTELATIFRVGRSLITSDLARLTEAGLITSIPKTADKRRTELALTNKGDEVSERFTDAVLDIIRNNLRAYSDSEIDLFSRMLRDARG